MPPKPPAFLLAPILCLLIGCQAPYISPNPRLTVENILAVRPGMDMAQVKAILGPPIEESSHGPCTISCDCNPERLCPERESYTFRYTEAQSGRTYPMLWVHFNARKKVNSVFVKSYSLLDDPCIYSVSSNPCDTLDPIVPLDSAAAYTTHHGLNLHFNSNEPRNAR